MLYVKFFQRLWRQCKVSQTLDGSSFPRNGVVLESCWVVTPTAPESARNFSLISHFLHYASPHPRGAGGCVSFHSRLSSPSVVGFSKLQGHETPKPKPFWMMLWYQYT